MVAFSSSQGEECVRYLPKEKEGSSRPGSLFPSLSSFFLDDSALYMTLPEGLGQETVRCFLRGRTSPRPLPLSGLRSPPSKQGDEIQDVSHVFWNAHASPALRIASFVPKRGLPRWCPPGARRDRTLARSAVSGRPLWSRDGPFEIQRLAFSRGSDPATGKAGRTDCRIPRGANRSTKTSSTGSAGIGLSWMIQGTAREGVNRTTKAISPSQNLA